MVYGIIEEDDYSAIKIGVTQTADNAVDWRAAKVRARDLQIGNKRRLCIVCGCAGDYDTEQQLHSRFGRYLIQGEWYELRGDVLQWMLSCKRDPLFTKVGKRRAKPSIRNITHGIAQLAAAISP